MKDLEKYQKQAAERAMENLTTERLIELSDEVIASYPCPDGMDLKSYRQGIYFGIIYMNAIEQTGVKELKEDLDSALVLIGRKVEAEKKKDSQIAKLDSQNKMMKKSLKGIAERRKEEVAWFKENKAQIAKLRSLLKFFKECAYIDGHRAQINHPSIDFNKWFESLEQALNQTK